MARLTRRTALIAIASTAAGCLSQPPSATAPTAQSEQPTETDTECEGEQLTLSPPTLGNPDADVTVSIYRDFACPNCIEFTLSVLSAIKQSELGSNAIEYRHRDFPIPVSEWSLPVANAARSVQDQAGDERFFEFVTALFESIDTPSEYSRDLLASVGRDVGVSGEQVRAASSERPYCQLLADERAAAKTRDVSATPVVFVNDKKLRHPDEATLRQEIR